MSLREKLTSNPVRVYLYAAVVAVYGVLVAVGVIADDDKVKEAILDALPVLLAVPRSGVVHSIARRRHPGVRACYGLSASKGTRRWRSRQAKARKWSPTTVAGNRS